MSSSPINGTWKRLYEEIVSSIEEQITKGKLKPGDRLPSERELSEQFDVSRTAVREAVKALREKGMVVVHPGRGTFITNESSEVIQNYLGTQLRFSSADSTAALLQVREMLEPEMAAAACESATLNDIAKLQAALDQMDTLVETQRTFNGDAFIEANLVFHNLIAEATRNSLVILLLTPIVRLIREQRQQNGISYEGALHAQQGHRRIMMAIEQRNKDAAREAMRAHIGQIREDEKLIFTS